VIAVRTKNVPSSPYSAVEREVILGELDTFLLEAVAELSGRVTAPTGPPFAIFHGQVNESTRSRVEVGLGNADGERELHGGRVVYGVAREGQTDYDPIHELYDAIASFITEHGLRQAGATREVYHGTRRLTDEIEVVWPVEP
jgi:hypothetical protein